jgi:hypothetical protein
MFRKTGKEMARLWLGDVPPDKVFWFHDGRAVKNLDEFAKALLEVSEQTFQHHLAKDKNDFSNWVRDVIGDVTLADQLRKATTQATAAHKVEARLNWLRARL